MDTLVGKSATPATRESFRKRLRAGDLDDTIIEIAVQDNPSTPSFEIPGMQGGVGMVNIGDIFGKGSAGKKKKKKMSVKESYEYIIQEESDKLIDQDQIIKEAKFSVENNGIVFLDEIDKVSARSERSGTDVSREGVQRDLLPLIEGCTVSTKYGMLKTDHILFIASGAFHLSKPSDLIPELQGRLPIRVELQALTPEDLQRILTEPKASLTEQYVALLKTEGVDLTFTEEGAKRIAEVAFEVNESTENIGARRLHTMMERLLEKVSFDAESLATQYSEKPLQINGPFVDEHLGEIAQDEDLSRFIL